MDTEVRKTVNENEWGQWRQTIALHDLGSEPLGRFAACLRDLPRGLWHVPFETYLRLGLKELRELPGHGMKRVSVVIGILRDLYEALARLALPDHLVAEFGPRFVRPIQKWILRTLKKDSVVLADELHGALLSPLIEQLRFDAGEQHAAMAEMRLTTPAPPMQTLAYGLGLGRSRLYDLQADAALAMQVRWPAGQELVSKLRIAIAQHGELDTLDTAISFFFPLSDNHTC